MPVTIVGNNTPTAGGVVYGDGANYASTSAGTSGQALVSNGASAPSFGTLGVAGGGTGLATLTANNVLLGNGTSALQAVAPGTAGNVLTSNGTTWTSAAASSTMVVLTSGTVSGTPTAIDVETGFTDTSYELILIYYKNIAVSSGAGNPSFQFRIGGVYTSANYTTRNQEIATSSSSVNSATGASSMVLGALPQIGTSGTSFAIIVQNRFQGGTAGAAFITNPWWGHQNNGTAAGTSYGFTTASGDVQGLRFLLTGGSGATQFTAGSYVAYGIKNT
jgi:hypothetical protein